MTNDIEKRIELDAPVSRVWRAITDYREFGEWFRVRLEEPFAPGQEARGAVLHPGYEHVTWKATVKEMQPERLFSFTWHPFAVDKSVDYSSEPATLVEFRLEPLPGDRTLLVITENGFADIPTHRRQDALLRNDQGWTQQIENIKRHVGAHAA